MTTNEGEYLPTRQSLLERLKDVEDQTSWKNFFDHYWKLIYSVARKAGLSDAEAQDVVQETMICVAKKIQGFAYDPACGSFKGWLKRLTQWRISDYFRKKQYQDHGRRMPREEPLRTSLADQLEDPAGLEVERAWDQEWENNLFETALQRVKERIDPEQYQLFHFHVCKQFPAKKVAQRLGVKLAAVYLAKYKVSALVKKEVKALEKSVR